MRERNKKGVHLRLFDVDTKKNSTPFESAETLFEEFLPRFIQAIEASAEASWEGNAGKVSSRNIVDAAWIAGYFGDYCGDLREALDGNEDALGTLRLLFITA